MQTGYFVPVASETATENEKEKDMSKFEVVNTKANKVLSSHETLDAAIMAEAKFLTAVKRSGGSASTTIQCGGKRFEDSYVSRTNSRSAARAFLA